MSRALFDKHIMGSTDKMYRYAYSILKNKDNASDVVQECLLKIWNKRSLLTEIKSIDSWAMRIVRNQCYDWVKINRYTLVGDEEILKGKDESTEERILMNDHRYWLNQVLKLLPEKYQEVFHLREVEELSYQDISEIMGISLSEVKVNLHRTRGKIKEQMQKIENYGIAN